MSGRASNSGCFGCYVLAQFYFVGSLHPNIQDSQGRPKRDPQTILQILTDLLSATNQYEVSNLISSFK